MTNPTDDLLGRLKALEERYHTIHGEFGLDPMLAWEIANKTPQLFDVVRAAEALDAVLNFDAADPFAGHHEECPMRKAHPRCPCISWRTLNNRQALAALHAVLPAQKVSK